MPRYLNLSRRAICLLETDHIYRQNPVTSVAERLVDPILPVTTGKIERWHSTIQAEFLTGKEFADTADAPAQLDMCVEDRETATHGRGGNHRSRIRRCRRMP